ncbi:MAG: hypothetical protein HY291_08275 [Planctomycetes bacterium]|nr:hypothetical protein [Planctomycetota bacterium]
MINFDFKFKQNGKSSGWGTLGAILAVSGIILAGLAFASLVALGLGIVVAALWNWLMPAIFGLPSITYWQAVGLLVLAHILLKGHFTSKDDTHGHSGDKEPSIDKEALAKDVAARVKALLDAERAQPATLPLPENPKPQPGT